MHVIASSKVAVMLGGSWVCESGAYQRQSDCRRSSGLMRRAGCMFASLLGSSAATPLLLGGDCLLSSDAADSPAVGGCPAAQLSCTSGGQLHNEAFSP